MFRIYVNLCTSYDFAFGGSSLHGSCRWWIYAVAPKTLHSWKSSFSMMFLYCVAQVPAALAAIFWTFIGPYRCSLLHIWVTQSRMNSNLCSAADRTVKPFARKTGSLHRASILYMHTRTHTHIYICIHMYIYIYYRWRDREMDRWIDDLMRGSTDYAWIGGWMGR